MPLYFSSHTTACLTKQALKQFMLDMMGDSEVTLRRTVSGQIAGRMLTEVESPDQPTLEKWFARRNINIEPPFTIWGTHRAFLYHPNPL